MTKKLKLSFELAEKFYYDKNEPQPFQKLPYNQFQIIFPYGVVINKQELRENLKEDYPNMTIFEIIAGAKKIYNSDYILCIKKIQGTTIEIEVKSSFDQLEKDIKFQFNPEEDNIIVKENLALPNQKQIIDLFFNRLVRVICRTIEYLNRPTEKIKSDTNKQHSNYKTPDSTSNNITYINKKDYQSNKTKKEYKRHKEVWEVRGHYRRYRDKNGNVIKKVWVEPHVRGPEKDDFDEEDKTYNLK